jgi:glycogen operon protein
MRAMLATLAFSQGVPMLAHGDELGRTQNGNNNAYAQDNEITWMNWDLDEHQEQLLAFTRKLIAVRQAHPVLRRRHFFRGTVVPGTDRKDVTWIRPDGKEMQDGDWHSEAHVLGMLIDGAATDEVDERGHAVIGDSLLLLLNGGDQQVSFTLPILSKDNIWAILIDTARDETPVVHSAKVAVEGHALMLLRFGTDRRVTSSEEARRDPLSLPEQHTL